MIGLALASSAVVPLPGVAATAVAWRAKGQLHLTVIAKATFAFAPDGPMPRVEPQEIFHAEVHHGNNPGRSIRFTSDLAPALARADVLFTGHAHAPPGSDAHSMTVRLAIFDGHRHVLEKQLLVQDKDGFRQMPILYERAATAAAGQDNPLGRPRSEGEPNILDPVVPERPAGFGPIGRAWPARKRLLGSLPRKALGAPIAEIPEGFEWSYFQAAPLDQRIELLRGDEWIVLDGLHPTLPRLQTRLPGARAYAKIHGLSAFGVSEGHLLELRADTLRVDGQEQLCTVVWRQSVPVTSEAALPAARIAAGVAIDGAAITWPDPRVLARAIDANRRLARADPRRAQQLHGGETLTLSDDEIEVVDAATPFRPAPRGVPRAPSGPARPRAPSLRTGTLTLDPDEEGGASHRQALPFDTPRRAPFETFTLEPDQEKEVKGKPALPFQRRVPCPLRRAPPRRRSRARREGR